MQGTVCVFLEGKYIRFNNMLKSSFENKNYLTII